LLGKGYAVSGIVKDATPGRYDNLASCEESLDLRVVELTDAGAVSKLISELRPTEIYNLAAPSVVYASWDRPIETVSFMAGSVTSLLDAIVANSPETRFFQASSSEMFRGAEQSPQTEQTPPRPTSPYGVGKVAGHNLVYAYRGHHGVHASSGILYNHESPRRPTDFVTRKVVATAVAIKRGETSELVLGDISTRRDWGYAVDYVEAMWQMLQQPAGDDYVLASGRTYAVEDLVNTTFSLLDLNAEEFIRFDPALMRRGDEALLAGDPSKAAEQLGWRASTDLSGLLELMIEAELAAVPSS
jgi:GDPmannose 4,6-dehydratase